MVERGRLRTTREGMKKKLKGVVIGVVSFRFPIEISLFGNEVVEGFRDCAGSQGFLRAQGKAPGPPGRAPGLPKLGVGHLNLPPSAIGEVSSHYLQPPTHPRSHFRE